MSQNTGVPTLVYFFTLRWSRQPYFSPYFCSIRVEAFLMLQTNGVCMVLGMEQLVFTSQAGKRQPTSACLSQAPKEVTVTLWNVFPRSLI